MGYSKRQFIEEAYGEIGMGTYVFDLDLDVLQRAARRLDAMMAEWNGRGIRLGYPIPASPDDGDLDDLATVPDWANEAIILNLAVRLSPGHGKTVSPQTLAAARRALDTVLGKVAMPPQVQITGLPCGAGAKSLDAPFLPAPSDSLTAGPDSELEFS